MTQAVMDSTQRHEDQQLVSNGNKRQMFKCHPSPGLSNRKLQGMKRKKVTYELSLVSRWVWAIWLLQQNHDYYLEGNCCGVIEPEDMDRIP